LLSRIENLENMIGQQSDRIDQLESELNEERDTRKKQSHRVDGDCMIPKNG
jgi:hypothetical protein